MNSKWMWLIGGVLIGVVASNQLRSLPLLNKLP